MNKARVQKSIRKLHRYLGLVFGVQFLFWTIGGLYFSWTNIKQVRGEDLRKEEPAPAIDSAIVAPANIIQQIRLQDQVKHIKSVQLADVLGKTIYQITYHNGSRMKTRMADAHTGLLRQPLTEKEAIQVAISRMKKQGILKSVVYLESAGGHHEYREKPLPAFAITFTGEIQTTVYVSAEMGTVQSFRNSRWRVFDFLWMLHTMDYQGRDNINNWLLRIFSMLGLITLFSGFALYIVSRKRKRALT
ncbi:MAG: PepSY domain-containing protein [Bacteroidetes bacterium]|nr:PepSY domain-containing protein [Bacteroidota bacterium]